MGYMSALIAKPMKTNGYAKFCLTILAGGLLLLVWPPTCDASGLKALDALIGARDAVLLADLDGQVLYEKNAHLNLIPASTIKILTALTAIHYLTPNYRFATEFYVDPQQNLFVKGYGDPLFISEVIEAAAAALSQRAERFNDLMLDDRYFDKPVVIPGRSPSFQPYDAPIGALSSNFNTVNFIQRDGRYVSAENQTPLIPFARNKLKAAGVKSGRITLSHADNDITLYTGHLLLYFLRQAGLKVNGQIRLSAVEPAHNHLFYTHTSPFDLLQVIAKMLEFSNNFMANQLVLACGAKAYGPPATLAKGVHAIQTYAQGELGLDALRIVEGSGLSRRNQISAHSLLTVLRAFFPYRRLMRHAADDHYKTGTLKGIRTRVGYLVGPGGQFYPYVILFNSPDKFPQKVVKILRTRLDEN